MENMRRRPLSQDYFEAFEPAEKSRIPTQLAFVQAFSPFPDVSPQFPITSIEVS